MASWASWLGSVAAWVAAAIAFGSAYANWKMNKRNTNRAAAIEAQKLLLEINKQYILDPALLALEGEAPPGMKASDEKLRATAYLKLNVFEIIVATLSDKEVLEPWTAYFEESLTNSNILSEELRKRRGIYHRRLTAAYDKWSLAKSV